MTDQPATTTIPISNHMRRFAQGASAAAKVREVHDPIDMSDDARTSLFWFYVGAMAAAEHGCVEPDDFDAFIVGARVHAPETPQEPPC